MKFAIKLMLILSIILPLFGCSSKSSKVELCNNPLFDGKVSEVTDITITFAGDADSVLWKTTDSGEIRSILTMFNNWSMTENMAEMLDLFLDYEIQFGSVLTIHYSAISAEQNGYCRIDRSYYYLPKEFCQYFDNVLTKS